MSSPEAFTIQKTAFC